MTRRPPLPHLVIAAFAVAAMTCLGGAWPRETVLGAQAAPNRIQAGGAITLDRALDRVAFTIENRTADRHRAALRLAVPAGAAYEVRVDGKRVALQPSGNLDYPLRADLDVGPEPPRVEIVKRPPTKG